jgi:hypothetical protein
MEPRSGGPAGNAGQPDDCALTRAPGVGGPLTATDLTAWSAAV